MWLQNRMGLTVPDYPNKWGGTTSAYISTTGGTMQVYSIAVGPVIEEVPVINDVIDETTGELVQVAGSSQVTRAGYWSVGTEFKVYRDKQHRLDNPNQHVEILPIGAQVYTEQLASDGVFTVLYDALKRKFPNGVDE